MEGDRGKVQLQDAGILEDECIGTGGIELENDFACALQLIVGEDGVERHMYFGMVQMGVLAELFDF